MCSGQVTDGPQLSNFADHTESSIPEDLRWNYTIFPFTWPRSSWKAAYFTWVPGKPNKIAVMFTAKRRLRETIFRSAETVHLISF